MKKMMRKLTRFTMLLTHELTSGGKITGYHFLVYAFFLNLVVFRSEFLFKK